MLPRTTRGWLIAGASTAAAVLIAAFLITYFVVLGGSSVAPLALSIARASASGSARVAPPASLTGTWAIASGSVAGYRVREQLAEFPAQSDAVGRTSSITGTVVLGGTGDALLVTTASLTVDVSMLTSDRGMRDQRLHQQGLQSDTYPKATFELADPITLPANASTGATVNVPATGRLTIHGITQTVVIPLTARISSNDVEVVGSTTFPFERFGMTPPSIAGFVSVQDSATMEFDIHLKRT